MITVLIADDNAVFNLSLSSFLTKEKDIKIIDMCLNGKEALLSYLRNKPDIMILDLDLPSLNGLQILDYLNQINDEKQLSNIIIISGNTRLKNKLTSLSKVYCILNKPCSFNEVLKKIEEIKENSIYIDSLKLSIFNYNANHPYNLKTLIHKVALKNNTTYANVKSAIYHAVDTMNRFVDIEYLKDTLPIYYQHKKITANDVISLSKMAL